MRSASLAAAALAGLVALVEPAAAFAYCRTSSCGNLGTGALCSPKQPSDCGKPLFWAKPCMSWSLHQGASKQIAFADAQQLFAKAFATWALVDCPGGGKPRIAPTQLDPTECAEHEYNKDRGNANNFVFRDDKWPYEGEGATLALTTVTYNLDTGEIYDADMEVNSSKVALTTGDTDVAYDLLSIATHEVGHFLGVAHSSSTDATMFANYVMGDVSLRDLSDDDRDAICAAYPPGEPAAGCDPTPRHGFSEKCGADQPAQVDGGDDTDTGPSSGGCAIAAAAPGPGGAIFAAVGLAIDALRRLRRLRRAGRR